MNTQEKVVKEYLKGYLGTEIEVEEIKELLDGSLNVTVKSIDPEIDGRCYYIHFDKLYELYANERNKA